MHHAVSVLLQVLTFESFSTRIYIEHDTEHYETE